MFWTCITAPVISSRLSRSITTNYASYVSLQNIYNSVYIVLFRSRWRWIFSPLISFIFNKPNPIYVPIVCQHVHILEQLE